MRVGQGVDVQAVVAQRVDECHAVPIARGPRRIEIDPACGCRRPEQAHAESPLFIGPVDETQRDREIPGAVDAERFESRQDPERAVEPSAVRD